MTLNESIKKELNNSTFDELQSLTREINTITDKRNEDFFYSIENSDLNKFKELVSLGFNINNSLFWKKLTNLHLSKSNSDILHAAFELFGNLNPQLVLSKSIYDTLDMQSKNYIAKNLEQYSIEYLCKNPSLIWKELLAKSMVKTLEFYEFKPDLFDFVEYYKLFDFVAKPIAFNNLLKNLNKFPNLDKYSNIHQFIIEYHATPNYFNSITKDYSLKFFLNDPIYYQKLKEIIKDKIDNPSKDHDADLMMGHSMDEHQYEKIKILHELGCTFPTSKKPYSNLFQKTLSEATKAQLYVISNIEDITQSQHVILSTVLHGGTDNFNSVKLVLIDAILQRYTAEQKQDIPSIIKGRDIDLGIELVLKYYNASKLELMLPQKTQNQPQNKIKI